MKIDENSNSTISWIQNSGSCMGSTLQQLKKKSYGSHGTLVQGFTNWWSWIVGFQCAMLNCQRLHIHHFGSRKVDLGNKYGGIKQPHWRCNGDINCKWVYSHPGKDAEKVHVQFTFSCRMFFLNLFWGVLDIIDDHIRLFDIMSYHIPSDHQMYRWYDLS